MKLSPGEIAIWSIGLDHEAAEDCLTPAERARADAAIDPAVRSRRLSSRCALRRILGAYLGVAPAALVLVTDTHGKPRLEGGPRFNLSHSGDIMLVAVSGGAEVGVDIERCGRLDADWATVTQRVFSSGERAQLERIAPPLRPDAALRGWVRKEAYAKARGAGFAYGFASFTVRLDTGGGALLVEDANDPEAAAGWAVLDLAAPPGFVASLAHAGCKAAIGYRSYAELAQ